MKAESPKLLQERISSGEFDGYSGVIWDRSENGMSVNSFVEIIDGQLIHAIKGSLIPKEDRCKNSSPIEDNKYYKAVVTNPVEQCRLILLSHTVTKVKYIELLKQGYNVNALIKYLP